MAYLFVFVFAFAFSYYFLFYRRANTHPNTPLASSSSSSSSSAPAFSSRSWKHHVFLSFRGEDTRNTFVGHLYRDLERMGIQTYKDDKILSLGEEINPALIEAIEQSQIAIIVFSPNYADSSWCLNELKHIMKCRKERGLIVVPIFYGVEPSDVRKQKRKYEVAFAKYESNENANVASWREALVEASGNSGQDFKSGNLDEAELIKNIVNKISKMKRPLTPRVDDNLVGLEARIDTLISKLQIGSDCVVMIGIWGVGGGGKTTLATSVYSQISGEFDGCCCIENIREQSSQINGLPKLQGKIISGVLKQDKVQEGSIEDGKNMIRDKLSASGRKVLLVLDDVDHLNQLEALAGSIGWFANGSRIIITTRDEHLLKAHKVDHVHNISLLDKDEATKLLRKRAGLDNRPKEDYKQLSEEVVSYAGGLPLALTVLGKFLCGRGIDEWKSTLARLKTIPEDDIVGRLKISYDGLKKVEQDLFLDIACFFRRDPRKDTALGILEACGLYPGIGLEVLREKALITISDDGVFDMHDLVQEMGHHIVRGDHPDSPEKHSRIWKEEDVLTICAMDATKDLDMIEAVRFKGNTKNYSPLQHLPPIVANSKNLRWIDWKGDLSGQLLTNFPQRKLCCLILRWSMQEQLWEGYKFLPNLKIMELYNLLNLTMLPNVAGLVNLESFKLKDCRNLQEVHSSFGDLEKLVFLCIEWCRGIKKFPSINRLKNLKTLSFRYSPGLFQLSAEIQHQQKKVENLPNDPHTNIENHHTRQLLWFSHAHLTELYLRYCELRDEDIGSSEWELPHLQHLDLSGNWFSRLDFGHWRLPRLKWLDVSRCKSLVELSNLPSSIVGVNANFCRSLERFGDASNCKWLWEVDNYKGKKLDPFDGERLLKSMLQGNAIEDYVISLTLQNQIPKGFVAGSFFGGKTFACLRDPVEDSDTFILLHLPDDWYNNFSGFLIRLVAPFPIEIDMEIIMKQEEEADEEDLRFSSWQDAQSGVQPPPEPEYDGGVETHVVYVSFSYLRQTTSLNPSFNIISFSIKSSYCSFAAELVPVKSPDDRGVQTTKVPTNSSEFWGALPRSISIQEDSNSDIKIQWTY